MTNYVAEDYETIRDRMLENVDDSFDKRQGAIIYDALAPTALEISYIQKDLENADLENDVDTASREAVIAACAMRSITPDAATASVLEAHFTPVMLDVPIGSRFNSPVANYYVSQKVSNGVYQVTCETTGTVGNDYTGTIVPIDTISGLETAEITNILIYGEDEQSTESLAEEYDNSFGSTSYGGNKATYEEACAEIGGVGAVKVESVWNGDGTVKLYLLDANFGLPTQTLIDTVQGEIDPNRDGKGDGIAPIGAVVTVVSAGENDIVVETTVTLDENYTLASVEDAIKAAVENYFVSLRETWQSNTSLVVRLAYIESAILDVTGVLDVTDTTLNGDTENIVVSNYDVPIVSEVIINE